MHGPSTKLPFTCVNCEADIVGTPTFHVGLPFCCAGCVADGPCMCSYDAEVAPEPAQVRFCLDLGANHVAEDRVLAGAGADR